MTERLPAALTALFVLQLAHGFAPAGESAEEGWFGAAIGLAALVGTAVAWYGVRRRRPWGRPLARFGGAAIPLGFVLYHGAWFSSPLTNPYWGDGDASVAQWLSVVAVMVAGIVVAILARAADRPVASGAAVAAG